MKKHKHPKNLKSIIMMSDGSHLKLNWISSKKLLKLESDYLLNPLWNSQKKKFK